MAWLLRGMTLCSHAIGPASSRVSSTGLPERALSGPTALHFAQPNLRLSISTFQRNPYERLAVNPGLSPPVPSAGVPGPGRNIDIAAPFQPTGVLGRVKPMACTVAASAVGPIDNQGEAGAAGRAWRRRPASGLPDWRITRRRDPPDCPHRGQDRASAVAFIPLARDSSENERPGALAYHLSAAGGCGRRITGHKSTPCCHCSRRPVLPHNQTPRNLRSQLPGSFRLPERLRISPWGLGRCSH